MFYVFLLDRLFSYFFILDTGADFLKAINRDYSNLLSAIFSFLLFIVTTVYVLCTALQVSISQKSIKLSQESLKQLEREHKTSVTPVLVPIEVRTHGGACFPINGSSNRHLNVFCNMKNIGNSPAIQIYTKIGLKLKFIKDDDRSCSSEYKYIGSLAVNDNNDVMMLFERDKLSFLLEDISIMLEKNIDRLENDNSQKLVQGATLVLNFVYSNIHNQYFKTIYERDIIGITTINREGNKRNYMINMLKLGDNEQFELMLINPSYSHLEIKILSDEEANEFINDYKSCSKN